MDEAIRNQFIEEACSYIRDNFDDFLKGPATRAFLVIDGEHRRRIEELEKENAELRRRLENVNVQ